MTALGLELLQLAECLLVPFFLRVDGVDACPLDVVAAQHFLPFLNRKHARHLTRQLVVLLGLREADHLVARVQQVDLLQTGWLLGKSLGRVAWRGRTRNSNAIVAFNTWVVVLDRVVVHI